MSENGTFHQQLVEQLRALVRGGRFGPGAQFLTEREIAVKFKTSRPTANKALSSLVSAGLLEVRRGAGTFVRESVLDYDLERLVSFTDKVRAVGKKPGTRLLEYRTIRARETPREIIERLRVPGDDLLVYMERIRLADAIPVIFERRHVVANFCPKMTRTDAKGSLYACWTEKCGLHITGADETIHAVNASKAEAVPLEIPPGTACFKIIATGHVDDETPLWHEETFYRADVYEFRNRIRGLSDTHAAVGKIRHG
jgi:GntR family transcriptional regulator